MEHDIKKIINWLVRSLSFIEVVLLLRVWLFVIGKIMEIGFVFEMLLWIAGAIMLTVFGFWVVCVVGNNKNDEPEETNQDTESENIVSLSAANAVKPIVKAVVKAKAVAPYQTKMCGLAKQFEDYDAELRNLGKETGNYKKAMETIKKEFNRQCDYVARIAEIEGKQGDMSGNEKTVEISKKVRKSYKAHRDEATKSIESLIGNAEQVVVLMQRDLQNQIFDAHAQVETGKINDMISKLEGSVQLDKEINAEAAESCMELKGIEQPSKE